MKTLFSAWCFALSFLIANSSIAPAHGSERGNNDHTEPTASQLPTGRYVGSLQMDGRRERLALEAQLFLESPDELTEFPVLKTIFKVSLGGYHTPEYQIFTFKNLRADFDTGDLTFDEPSNDLTFTAKAHSPGDRTMLKGRVWSRSSALGGTFTLRLESDEPSDEDEGGAELPLLSLAPALDGQYLGTCEGEETVFQIQTAKGLSREAPGGGADLFDYAIVARLGSRAREATRAGLRPWESYGSFAGGAFDLYRGRLLFRGPSSMGIECTRDLDRLQCQYRTRAKKVRCAFQKSAGASQSPTLFPRIFHLAATAEQREALPEQGSVPDKTLASLLSGSYQGYLHHEASDRYQRAALDVTSTLASENPHNPNKVFISATSVLFMGSNAEGPFLTSRFEPRSFYLRPGFTLSAPGSDAFIAIDEWKTGFIRGVWFSKTYGRVGTVEFVKGPLAPPPANAHLAPAWTGEFQGSAGPGTDGATRWMSLALPPQPAERTTSLVPFVGSYQSIVGLTAIEPLETGLLDPYTGTFAWKLEKNDGITLISGRLAEDGHLLVHWPPTPNVTTAAMDDYKYISFTSIKEEL